MRDIKRIPRILKELETIWKKYPDLRLGQLISNTIDVECLYHIEDEDLVKIIKDNYDTLYQYRR